MNRPDGAWLGGVCAATARQLGFNAIGVRVVAVLLFLVWPFMTGAAYLLCSWLLGQEGKGEPASAPRSQPRDSASDEWDRRLAEIDRQLDR